MKKAELFHSFLFQPQGAFRAPWHKRTLSSFGASLLAFPCRIQQMH
ncbi:hypothetical protein ASZ84_02194 [Vibrio cholerae]|nr:hypothetical protein ASZ84_02194 [Vibrio cholerae]